MFLTKNELATVQVAEITDLITGADDTKVQSIIAEQIAVMTDYLRNFYDTEAIFSATDDDRAKTVLRWLKHLVVYDLACIRFPEVPPAIEKNYNEAMRWLEKVNEGKINPDLPLRQVDTDGDGEPDSDTTLLLNGGRKNYPNHW